MSIKITISVENGVAEGKVEGKVNAAESIMAMKTLLKVHDSVMQSFIEMAGVTAVFIDEIKPKSDPCKN